MPKKVGQPVVSVSLPGRRGLGVGGMGVGEVLGIYLGTVHDVCICLFRCLHAVALDDAFFFGGRVGGGGTFHIILEKSWMK